MKAVLIFLAVLVGCLCLAYAAPANQAPKVSLLKYKDDADFEAIQRQIIAQYEQELGGTSQIHHVQTVSAINPHTFRVNI